MSYLWYKATPWIVLGPVVHLNITRWTAHNIGLYIWFILIKWSLPVVIIIDYSKKKREVFLCQQKHTFFMPQLLIDLFDVWVISSLKWVSKFPTCKLESGSYTQFGYIIWNKVSVYRFMWRSLTLQVSFLVTPHLKVHSLFF